MSEIQLPEGWVWSKIGAVTIINPKLNQKDIPDDLAVSFLPMKMVEEVTGKFDLSEIRQYKEVKKGYTFFQDGDVIFAKVTPCMENGKIAVVDHLENGLGFGSTEFHVFRCEEKLDNKYLFFFLVQRQFRHEAEGSMTGAVGLRRVPKSFLENYPIPLPPLPVQQQIVARIEELFSELDAGTQELQTALKRLKMYRQAVFHDSFKNLHKRYGATSISHFLTASKHAIKAGPFGSALKKEYYVPSGYKVYGQEQVIKNDASFGDYYINQDRYELLSSCKISPYDILISLVGTIGKVMILPAHAEPGIINPRLIKITLDHDKMLPQFFKYYFESDYLKNQYSLKSHGATMDILSLGILKGLPFPKCPIEEQKQLIAEIEARLSEADAMEATIHQSLKQAEALRQSILKRAFEGRLIQPEGNIIPKFTSPVKQQTNVINEQLSLF